MKNCLLLCIVTGAISGCTHITPLTTTCGGTSGIPATKITYGDSQIVVKPKSNVRVDREFQFKLDPKRNSGDPVDYRDVLVTVTGKDAASSWISGSATYNTAPGSGNTFFGGCVPNTAMEGDVFSYDVKVREVGALDPRAEVVR